MGILSGLKPEKVFEYFELLCSVPHGSGNTDAISRLCEEFAAEHGLPCRRDGMNNVVITKKATPGYESAPSVILQGHLDMVCAKAPGCTTDMSSEPVKLRVSDGFVSAEGTSLGADDGTAVAMIMAVLASDDIEHPEIEAVFTSDEETGMFGAKALDTSLLKSRLMINLDSEREGVILAGCAGGARVDCDIPVTRVSPEGKMFLNIKIHGLEGGHSGAEINKGRANSTVLAARILRVLSSEIPAAGLCLIQGGSFDNVITPETEMTVAIFPDDAGKAGKIIDDTAKDIAYEYGSTEPGLKIDVTECASAPAPIYEEDTKKVAAVLFTAPYGVQSMDPDLEGLVRSSLNIGVIRSESDRVHFSYCVRSSITSEKEMIIDKLFTLTEAAGGTCRVHDDYPGWKFRKESRLRDIVAGAYKSELGTEAVIFATHGGLECGLFIDKMPGLDCISIGPDMFDVHSPKERLSVRSTENVWKVLIKALRDLKDI